MAWQVTKRIWDYIKTDKDTKQGERLLLLALADIADENGICWPRFDTSYQTLADMAGVNRRSAMRIIDDLCKVGHLAKVDTVGRGHSNIYAVTIGLTDLEKEGVLSLIGVTHNTISNEESEGEKEEMVLPITPPGVTGNTICELNGVTGNTHPIKSPSSPLIISEDIDELPETKPEEVKVKKGREPLSPAFKKYTEITGNYKVPTYWRNKIAQDVGEKPEDIEFWGKVVIGYTSKWFYGNVGVMLEYFNRKEIPNQPVSKTAFQQNPAQRLPQPDAAPPPATPEPAKVELTPEEKILERFKERATERIPGPQWREHIAPMRVVGCPNGRIQVEVNRFTKELIEGRFNKVLEPIALELNPEGGFEYVVI